MVTAHRTTWRFAASLHDLRVLRGRDLLPDERADALPGLLAARKVDGWLREPSTGARLRRLYFDVMGHDDADDDEVARELRGAFETGALVALRLERALVSEGAAPEEEFVPRGTPEQRLTWIEVELVDAQDKPMPGRRYRVTTPDGAVHEGSLDVRGFARIDGIDPGTCKVAFPDFDQDSWKKV